MIDLLNIPGLRAIVVAGAGDHIIKAYIDEVTKVAAATVEPPRAVAAAGEDLPPPRKLVPAVPDISDRRRYERERKRKQRAAWQPVPVVPHTVPDTLSLSSLVSINNSKEEKERETVPDSKLTRPTPLPADWKPDEAHYELGSKLGFSATMVAFCADGMRDWAEANSHRSVTQQSNWNAYFRSWLRRNARDPIQHRLGFMNGVHVVAQPSADDAKRLAKAHEEWAEYERLSHAG